LFGKADYHYMARAIRLAQNGIYTTDPNPRVGCVIVKNDKVVGEGWHERAGKPHAEINALKIAGSSAEGATAYVSLEPCSHHGRTPPCSEALIQAKLSRVVCAMQDPNPKVAGSGLAQLKAAGVDVVSGLMEAQAQILNPGFIMRMRDGRPLIRTKMAMSMDGRTAMATGESKWITGKDARRDVHLLRARSSAILTGIATVLADDPSLNARVDQSINTQSEYLQPTRVVLDSSLSMPPSAKMLSVAGRTIIFTCSNDAAKIEQLNNCGAEVFVVDSKKGQVELAAVMSQLAKLEINEVMVEAGARLNGALIEAGLIDELIVYMAPILMGDKALGLFALNSVLNMEQRIALKISDIRPVGDDWRITAKIVKEN